jgi:hypothetical protein
MMPNFAGNSFEYGTTDHTGNKTHPSVEVTLHSAPLEQETWTHQTQMHAYCLAAKATDVDTQPSYKDSSFHQVVLDIHHVNILVAEEFVQTVNRKFVEKAEKLAAATGAGTVVTPLSTAQKIEVMRDINYQDEMRKIEQKWRPAGFNMTPNHEEYQSVQDQSRAMAMWIMGDEAAQNMFGEGVRGGDTAFYVLRFRKLDARSKHFLLAPNSSRVTSAIDIDAAVPRYIPEFVAMTTRDNVLPMSALKVEVQKLVAGCRPGPSWSPGPWTLRTKAAITYKVVTETYCARPHLLGVVQTTPFKKTTQRGRVSRSCTG